jgi:hypothetical protein
MFLLQWFIKPILAGYRSENLSSILLVSYQRQNLYHYDILCKLYYWNESSLVCKPSFQSDKEIYIMKCQSILRIKSHI